MRKKGYRGFSGAAAGELDAIVARANGPHQCPSCGHEWRGSSAPVPVPVGLPRRTAAERELRLEQLQATSVALATALVAHVGRELFDLWLADLRLTDTAGGVVYVATPSDRIGWLRARFVPVLNEVASTLAGRPMRVVLWAPRVDVPGWTLGDVIDMEELAA